ncbi:MAG: Fe-S protein assembly co-chaperone HscB [Alphaproteobacteria bacterium]|nr:Fe-S protein assembly co-chaperone HscB [Alphaproteobacteria bacterium]
MMSYFEILGLPAGFSLNLKALEQAYFAAQRATHPDRFIGKGEAERMAAITRSQQVNDAYETLKNPLTRAEHLLTLQGIAALADDAVVVPEILAEMMELRERIFEHGGDGASLAAIVGEIRGMAVANEKALAAAFATADYAAATHETIRLQYLGKAMEEAHMLIYRLKAAHG